MFSQQKLTKLLFALILSLTVSACGGGGSGDNDPSPSPTPSPTPPAVDNTATLNWQPSVKRMDETDLPIGDIASYRIYQGSDAANLSMLDTVTDSTVTTYTVNNLSTGTHFFAVTIVDTNGTESAYSSILSKTVN